MVICVDNRGVPAPRGRAFRKSVYKQIGILSSSDQARAVEQILSSRPYLDPNRVGVWGWSGGGTMSLNLLFRYTSIYRTAISVAPVPDMQYYDTIYQVCLIIIIIFCYYYYFQILKYLYFIYSFIRKDIWVYLLKMK